MVEQAGKGRILVAEDDPVNRKLLAIQLQRLGYEADFVLNGAQAVAALARQSYSLILMDCDMPVMDGLEATRQIRTSLHAQLPVIAVTAHVTEGARQRCLMAGMSDFLAKPVNLNSLSQTVGWWLSLYSSVCGLRKEVGPTASAAITE